MQHERSTETAPTLWRHRDFLCLWSAQITSLLGSEFSRVALPLIAVTVLGASPLAMGLLAAIATAPNLLFSLPAGAWVDRQRRRPLLITGDLIRAVVLLAVPISLWTGHASITLLGVVGFIVGTCSVLFDVSYQAYLPSLLDKSQLLEGNSKLELARSVTQMGGPGLAGLVVQLVSAPAAVLIDAISFLLSGIFIGTMKHREPTRDAGAQKRPLKQDILEGLSFVRRHECLFPLAVYTGISNFLYGGIMALYMLYMTRDLQLTPMGVGLVFGSIGVGTLFAAMLIRPTRERLGLGGAVVASALGTGIAGLLVVFARPGFALPLMMSSEALGSLAVVVGIIASSTLRQSVTPPEMQGRVAATMRLILVGTAPLGGVAAGLLGEALGVRQAITILAVANVFPFLWLLRAPVLAAGRAPAVR
ncbi:MAG: MFS transporter [Deltaproteobacteria bacterium]|nr:MFS transporter [Deltaproteobacteria bacterium]